MEISNAFVGLACNIFWCITIYAQPSLHAEWTNAHIARTDHAQTTIDTFFSLVQKYKTIPEIAQVYAIDLTHEDQEMLRQFAVAFTLDKNSYKKKHWFWLLSPAYYHRKVKASRAKKLKNLFATTEFAAGNAEYFTISIGATHHEVLSLSHTRQYNNHSRTAVAE